MSTRSDLAIAQRRAAVALQIDADHLPALRELGQVGAEHLDLAQAAMKEQQRLALAIDGVVVVHAVDRGMAALGGLGRCGLHGRLLLGCVNDRRSRKAGGNSRQHCDQRLNGHRGSPASIGWCPKDAQGRVAPTRLREGERAATTRVPRVVASGHHLNMKTGPYVVPALASSARSRSSRAHAPYLASCSAWGAGVACLQLVSAVAAAADDWPGYERLSREQLVSRLSESKEAAPALTAKNLSEQNLAGVDFRGANLSASVFNRAQLEGAKFDRCNLTVSFLEGATLPNASFKGAMMFSVQMAGATLTGANLSGARLIGDLRKVDLSRATLTT